MNIRQLALPAVPVPASSMPPAVGATGSPGSATTYARGDHTHKSSVQAARMAVAGGGGQFTWTFPVPYAAGELPICTATVENSGNQPYVVNLVGQPTNTAATFAVFRAQSQTLGGTLLAIAGAVISIFGWSPNGVYVNCIARLPTQ